MKDLSSLSNSNQEELQQNRHLLLNAIASSSSSSSPSSSSNNNNNNHYPLNLLTTLVHSSLQTEKESQWFIENILSSPSFYRNPSFHSLVPSILAAILNKATLALHQTIELINNNQKKKTTAKKKKEKEKKLFSSSSSSSSSSSFHLLDTTTTTPLSRYIAPLLALVPELPINSNSFTLGFHAIIYFYAIQSYTLPTTTTTKEKVEKEVITSTLFSNPSIDDPSTSTSTSSPFLTLFHRNPNCASVLWQILSNIYFSSSSSSSSSSSISSSLFSLQRDHHPHSLFFFLNNNVAFGIASFQLAYTLLFTSSLSLFLLSPTSMNSTHTIDTSPVLQTQVKNKPKRKKEKEKEKKKGTLNITKSPLSFLSFPSRDRIFLDLHQFYLSSLLPSNNTGASSSTKDQQLLGSYFHCLWTRLLASLPPTPQDPFLSRSHILANAIVDLNNKYPSSLAPSHSSPILNHHQACLLLFVLHDLVTRIYLNQAYETEIQIALTFLPAFYLSIHHPLDLAIDTATTSSFSSSSSFLCLLVQILSIPIMAFALFYPSSSASSSSSPPLSYLTILNVLKWLQHVLDSPFIASETSLFLSSSSSTSPNLYLSAWILPLLQLKVHPHAPIAHLATELYARLRACCIPILLPSSSSSFPSFSSHPALPSWLGPWVHDWLYGVPYFTATTATTQTHRCLFFPFFFYRNPDLATTYLDTTLLKSTTPLFDALAHPLLFLFFLSTLEDPRDTASVRRVFARWVPSCIATHHPWLSSAWLHVVSTWATAAHVAGYLSLSATCLDTLVRCWAAWPRSWPAVRQAVGSVLATLAVALGKRGVATENAGGAEATVAPAADTLLRLLQHGAKQGCSKREADDLTDLVRKFVRLPFCTSASGSSSSGSWSWWWWCWVLDICNAAAPVVASASLAAVWHQHVAKHVVPVRNDTPEIAARVFRGWVHLLPAWPVYSDEPGALPERLKELLDTHLGPCLPFPRTLLQEEGCEAGVVRVSRVHALALLALVEAPGWPATFMHVTTLAPRHVFAHCFALLREEASKDQCWLEAVTAFYKRMVQYEVEITVPRSLFLPLSSSALPFAQVTKKHQGRKEHLLGLVQKIKDSCIQACKKASSMVQPVAQATLLVLAPTTCPPLPAFISKLAFPSSTWLHRNLPLPFWLAYWTSTLAPPHYPTDSATLRDLFAQVPLEGTPHDHVHWMYACTGYALAAHPFCPTAPHHVLHWLMHTLLGSPCPPMYTDAPGWVRTAPATLAVPNATVERCLVTCVAALLRVTGDDEDVHRVVSYGLVLINETSSLDVFEATVSAMARILALRHRPERRRGVPGAGSLGQIQAALAAQLVEAAGEGGCVEKGIRVAMSLGDVQRHRPGAVPGAVLDAARRWLGKETGTATQEVVQRRHVYAVWVLAFSMDETDQRLVREHFPVSMVTEVLGGRAFEAAWMASLESEPCLVGPYMMVLGYLHQQSLPPSAIVDGLRWVADEWQSTRLLFHQKLDRVWYLLGLLGFHGVGMDHSLPSSLLDSLITGSSTLSTDDLCTFTRVLRTVVDTGLHQCDARLTKCLLPLFAWVFQAWTTRLGNDEDEDNPTVLATTHATSLTRSVHPEPLDYARFDASTSYLRHVVSLIHPSSSSSSSSSNSVPGTFQPSLPLSVRAHLLSEVFCFQHPLPSLDWYPILTGFSEQSSTSPSYFSHAWRFAVTHVASSYSCLDFLLDLVYMPNKPLEVWEAVVGEDGFPLLLSLPSNVTTNATHSTVVGAARGQKGMKVYLSEEKKTHAFRSLLMALFPGFTVAEHLLVHPSHEEDTVLDAHADQRGRLQTTFLKNLVTPSESSSACLTCLLDVPALKALVHQLVEMENHPLTPDQCQYMVPFFDTPPPFTLSINSRNKSITGKLVTAHWILSQQAPSEEQQNLARDLDPLVFELLRSAVLDVDPMHGDDVHRLVQRALCHVVSPPLWQLPTLSSSTLVHQHHLSWMHRLLDYLYFLLTTLPDSGLHQALTLIQYYLVPFLDRSPRTTDPLTTAGILNHVLLPTAMDAWLSQMSLSMVASVLKKAWLVARVRHDPVQWKVWVFHLIAKYRGLAPWASEWPGWVASVNESEMENKLFC